MRDIVKKATALITPAYHWASDVVATKAYGVYVEAQDGKKYVDFTCGIAVTNIGHCPPKVVEAAKSQLEKFLHSGGTFYHEPVVKLAEKLKEITPDGIDMFFFSNAGAEVVEGAIKLARYVSRKPNIIGFTGSFHGRTMGAVSLTSSAGKYRRHYQPLLGGIYHVPYPYCYRCPLGLKRKTCELECFGLVEYTLEHLSPIEDTAAFIIEPVLGEGGYVVPPKEYLQKLRELCDKTGIYLIFDEVQTGMGRTCKWFASEHFGVAPDIMTIAKAIASGLPLSALGAKASIMKKWPVGVHGTTFGGNPVSCVAALATIETIESENLLEEGMKKANKVMKWLRDLQKETDRIGDVRGLGLMIGIEFVKPDGSPDQELCDKVVKHLYENGYLILTCGLYRNVIRYIPPLITPLDLLERSVELIREGVKKYS